MLLRLWFIISVIIINFYRGPLGTMLTGNSQTGMVHHGPGQQGSTDGDENHPEHRWNHLQSINDINGVRPLHRAQRILKDNTYPVTVCSPCCHLTEDTQVSAAIPPDYRAASLLKLWDSSVHLQTSVNCNVWSTKDSNIFSFFKPYRFKKK